VIATIALNLLSLVMPIIVLQIYDRVLPNRTVTTLFWFAAGLMGATVIEALLRWARAYLTGWSAVRYQHSVTCRAVEHLLRIDLPQFEREPTGVHLNRLQMIDSIAEFVGSEARLVGIDLCFIILFLLVFWTIGGALVLIPIGLLAATGLTALALSRRLREALAARAEAEDRRSSFVLEVLTGIETVKSLAMEPLMLRRYERLKASAAAIACRLIWLSNASQHLGGILSNVTMALVAVFGARLVIEEQLSLGGLSACMMLASRAIQPPLKAFSLLFQFERIADAKRRVSELFQLPAEATARDGSRAEINGNIALSGVSFSYTVTGPPLLDNISLSIAAGACVAVTGGSGVGKSTLLMLLNGMLRPSAGDIDLDGVGIGAFDPDWLRRHVVLVAQHHVLFRGTILDNLTMFRRDDPIQEGLAAARALGLDRVISRLPDGYDTEIKDNGDCALAEGIRQGIAAARAFARDAKVILFDDANGCFDARADEHLARHLRALKGTVTVVLVTHRPALLALADRVFELKAGRLQPCDPLGLAPAATADVPDRGAAVGGGRAA
jgi:ATP-binding cassette subfamily C protein LapB